MKKYTIVLEVEASSYNEALKKMRKSEPTQINIEDLPSTNKVGF